MDYLGAFFSFLFFSGLATSGFIYYAIKKYNITRERLFFAMTGLFVLYSVIQTYLISPFTLSTFEKKQWTLMVLGTVILWVGASSSGLWTMYKTFGLESMIGVWGGATLASQALFQPVRLLLD